MLLKLHFVPADILPRELPELTNDTSLSNDTIYELSHTVIIPSQIIQQYGIGWWYIGVREHGKLSFFVMPCGENWDGDFVFAWSTCPSLFPSEYLFFSNS